MPTPAQTDALAAFRAALATLAEVDATALYGQRDEVIHALQGATFPALTIEDVPASDDADEHQALRCPHCASLLSEYDDDTVTVVDVSERWTHTYAPSAEDFAEHTVRVAYDDTADYQGLTYACGACEAPVALPAGWSETAA